MLCFGLTAVMLVIPLSIVFFRSLMTVLNKKTYAGLSLQKAKITLFISIPPLLFILFALLMMMFASNKPSPASFRYFVGVEAQPDIELLYDKNNSHDEFNRYEVCFRARPASIEKIIAHNQLVLIKKNQEDHQDAVQCAGDTGTMYTKPKEEKKLFSHHQEILFYNETTQTAWYKIDEVP